MNCVLSIGLIGSWFWSCVISSCRNWFCPSVCPLPADALLARAAALLPTVPIELVSNVPFSYSDEHVHQRSRKREPGRLDRGFGLLGGGAIAAAFGAPQRLGQCACSAALALPGICSLSVQLDVEAVHGDTG